MQLTDLHHWLGDWRGERREFDHVIIANGVAYATNRAAIARADAPGFPDGYYEPPLFLPVNDPTLPPIADTWSRVATVFHQSCTNDGRAEPISAPMLVKGTMLVHCRDALFAADNLPEGLLFSERLDKTPARLVLHGEFVLAEADPYGVGL